MNMRATLRKKRKPLGENIRTMPLQTCDLSVGLKTVLKAESSTLSSFKDERSLERSLTKIHTDRPKVVQKVTDHLKSYTERLPEIKVGY